MSTNEMGTMMTTYSTSGLVWGIGLFVMGGLLIATALASITPVGMGHMGLFGLLMIAYGVVMLFVGAAMSVHVTPMMNGYLCYSKEVVCP